MDLNYYDEFPEGERTKVESTDVYLAKPGQRLIGVLNGVEKDSATLEINLNNTDVIQFTLDRIVDGQVSNFYDLVERHYEIYVPKYGWFKINEEPEMSNDGNIETKTVRAESLEIELQQYDLVDFNVNVGNEASREYLAIDNTYELNDYTFFYDNVKFYRDTTYIQNALDYLKQTSDTIANLKTYVSSHFEEMITCPRIKISVPPLPSAVNDAAADYENQGEQDVADGLRKRYKDIVSSDSSAEYKQVQYKQMVNEYPVLKGYITIVTNNVVDGETIKASEILQRELQRQNELSLMWLVLHEHNWEVGYVDPWMDETNESALEWDQIIIDDDKIQLANKVGMFQVDSQDVYTFLTQQVAAYFRCIFVFDTINRKVNCFNINNVGYDTNIYLSFRNIMNSVTRSSDTDLYTVFHVRGGEDLDFTDANFGEDWIEDIHYFLNTKHFTRDFIAKYEEWEYTRDYKRPEYMQLSKEYKNQLDVVSEILDRVPVDSSDPKQYSTFTDDDLSQEKANQEAMLAGYKSFFPLAEETVEPISVPQSLKILGIGASHSRDGLRWLCKILKDAGVQNVVVGNTFIGSTTIKQFYESLNPSNSKHSQYEYMKYVSSDPTKRISVENTTLDAILLDQQWDVIIFQQRGIYAGVYGSWVQSEFDINWFVDYVKEKVNNPNLKIGITAHWSFGDNYDDNPDLYERYYASNPRKQLAANLEVAEKVRKHMTQCDYVVPTGLAVNYARRVESLRSIKNKLLKMDGNHLEDGIPMYLVAMTYAMTIVPTINVTTVPWYPTSSDDPNIEVGATEINAMYARQCAARATGQDPYYDLTTNWEALRESIYWPNYKMIRDIVIPNIDVEILNRALDMDADDQEEDFDEDYKLDFDTYGDSYGVNELKYQLNAINNKITVLKANGYNKKSKDGDEYHDAQYELYKKYLAAKKSCQNALNERQDEYEFQKKELDGIKKIMDDVKDFVDKRNEQFGFTEEELTLLDRYYIHTDYENQNIATTSVSTNEQRVDLAYKLLLYAKEQLSAESHPQWDWSTTQDNLLLIPEFKDWYGTKKDTNDEWNYTQLYIGNFVRVGFREDDSNRSLTVLLSEEDYQDPLLTDERDHGLVGTFVNAKNEGYQAKLRVIKISINPFMLDTNIDIEFSSMVQYKYKRNDFVSILQAGNSSSKNKISSGIVSNPDKDNTFVVDSNMIMQLMSNGAFNSYVTDIASASGGGGGAYAAVQQSISRGSMHGLVASITSETLGSAEIDVSQLTGTDEAFNNLIANHIGAASINTSQIVGDFADIATIISDYIDTDFIKSRIANIGHLDADSGLIKTLETNVITSKNITTALLHADTADFDDFTADTGFIQYLNSGVIEAGSVTADKIIAGLVSVEDPEDYSLLADSAFIQYLNTGVINTGQITTETLMATIAHLTTADVQNLSADNALVRGILTVGENQITTIAEGAISTATISADQITSGTIDTERIDVSDIITVGTNSITTIAEGVISTATINAENIDTTNLTAQSTFIQDILTVGTDAITTIAEGTITTDNVIASLVQADIGDFNDFTAQSGFIQYLNSGIIEAGTVSADTIIAGLASVTDEQISKFDLLAGSAYLDYLESNLIVASEIQVDDLKAKLANITVAQIDELSTNHAFINSLQSLSSTAATSVINDAYIYNAVAGKITVGDLAAGDITISNSMRILSENGNLIMNGSALQILGEDSNGDPYVGVQLGYATNGTPSLILRNEDGTTILDPTGITSDAIADGLIVNDMIHNGTIQKSKLGFQIIEPNAQGGIDITQVYDGNGGLFGTEYTSFKQGTQSALAELAQDIEDSANYDLYIETPNGTNIWGGNIQLNVKLLKNNVDVTDDYDASCFIWTRTSRDHDADLYWNSNHNQGAKVITITGNDVRMNADFQCKFEYNNITVVSGE